MEAEEIIARHLGSSGEIELVNNKGEKDKFATSSLAVEDLPELLTTMKVLKGTETNPTAIMDNFTPEVISKIADLGVKALKPNYPNIPDATLKELVIRNLLTFIIHLWNNNLNMNLGATDVRRDSRPFRALEKKKG